jgi:heme exporter protein B
MSPFSAVIWREVRLGVRQGGGAPLAVGFFVVVVALFPLGVGPEAVVLARIGAGVLWVAALLAMLVSLDRLFQADYEDGSLELLVLSPVPLVALVQAKCLAHWLTTGLPLMLAAPVLALLLQMPAASLPVLTLSIALGTPSLSLVGALGAGLTVGIRRGGVLNSLLILPLYVPVLIFGVGAVEAANLGLDASAHLYLLGAYLLAAAVLAPLAAASALKSALE